MSNTRMLDTAATALGTILLFTNALAIPTALRIRGRVPFFVATLVTAAASVVLVFILLSLANALTRRGILATQAVLAAAALALWALSGRPRPPTGWQEGLQNAIVASREHPAGTIAAALAMVALIVQLVVAVRVAPNNWDSMTYHLARIGYWLENHSATPFSGGSNRQNGSPPNGEMLQGWTMAVSRTDRLANLVQWLALVGTAAVTYSGARLLRFSASAAVFAAALFVIMPEPILQATTTQNDVITSFFVVAIALFGVRGIRDGSASDLVVAAGAAGLAVGTKGTALLAGPPLLIVLAAAVWAYRPRPMLVAGACGLVVAGVAAFGAFGYLLNVKDAGSPFRGINDQVARKEPIPTNFVQDMWTFVELPGMSVPWLQLALERAGEKLAHGVESGGFTYQVDSSVQEDTSAFGALGLFLFLPVVVITAFWPRVRADRRLLALAVLVHFVAFSIAIGWNPWLGRILMPCVALGAPLLAVLASRAWLRALAVTLGVVSLVPSVFQNPQKPLLMAATPTVFGLDRIAQETLIRPEIDPVLRQIETIVGDRAPLGFAGGEDSWDYPLFGEHRQRRVVRLTPSTVTYDLMARDRLAGVVFFNVGPPPSRLKAFPLGGDYYLVRANRG